MVPARLVLARMPVALLAPVIPIVPLLVTLLLLLIVTAAPPLGLTEPVVSIVTSWPDVVTGVVMAVLMTCCAPAGVAIMAARAPRPVVVNSKRMRESLFFRRDCGGLVHVRVVAVECRPAWNREDFEGPDKRLVTPRHTPRNPALK